jgi:hypothetical protein
MLEQLAADDSRTVAAAATEVLGDSMPPPPPAPSEAAPSEAADTTPRPTAVGSTRTSVLDDRWFVVAGGLAMAGAVLMFLALFPAYVSDFQLMSLPATKWSLIIWVAGAVGAGGCLLVPRTRHVIGPGLLLGAVATAPNACVYAIIYLTVAQEYGAPGGGLWLELAAGTTLVLAAVVAAIAVARTSAVRFEVSRPDSVIAWLVVLLGLAGAVALIVQVLERPYLPSRDQGFIYAEDLPPHLWTTAMALVIPAIAVAASPRRFGVALLAGWIGCASAAAIWGTGFEVSPFAVTVLGLLVTIVPFARAPRHRASHSRE